MKIKGIQKGGERRIVIVCECGHEIILETDRPGLRVECSQCGKKIK